MQSKYTCIIICTLFSSGCRHLHERNWQTHVLMLIRRADIHATLDITNTLLCDDQWTIIQRRVNGNVSFDRPWDDYAAGFGDLDGSFWIGLQLIHTITSSDSNQLHIYLESFTDGKIHLNTFAMLHLVLCNLGKIACYVI